MANLVAKLRHSGVCGDGLILGYSGRFQAQTIKMIRPVQDLEQKQAKSALGSDLEFKNLSGNHLRFLN